jgi:DNA-binding PadR family transcriptional regulator
VSSVTMTPAAFHVLLALAAGHAHGYAVMRHTAQVTGGAVRLGPGTLYRTISRLVADGLVAETDQGGDPDAPHDARRRYYRLTPAGRAAVQAEAERMAVLVRAAADAGLLPASAPTDRAAVPSEQAAGEGVEGTPDARRRPSSPRGPLRPAARRPA